VNELQIPDNVKLPKEIYQLGDVCSIWINHGQDDHVNVVADVKIARTKGSTLRYSDLREIKELLEASRVNIQKSDREDRVTVNFCVHKDMLEVSE
jgi:hypothetical protein